MQRRGVHLVFLPGMDHMEDSQEIKEESGGRAPTSEASAVTASGEPHPLLATEGLAEPRGSRRHQHDASQLSREAKYRWGFAA